MEIVYRKNEFARQINLLTSVGYTVIFISHETTRTFRDEKKKKFILLEIRSIDPICDLVDIIGYAAVNGLDENEIKSSLFKKFKKLKNISGRDLFNFGLRIYAKFKRQLRS